MGLKFWGQPASNNDYYFIKLIFTTNMEPSVSMYSYNGASWVSITLSSEIIPGVTDHYAIGPTPTDSTLGSGTIIMTWQGTSVIPPGYQNINDGTLINSCFTDAPNTIYFPIYWNAPINAWYLPDCSYISFSDPFVPSVPCFSKDTMVKLLRHVSIKKPSIIVRSYRGNKQMIRANYGLFGSIEATNDHPFIFNGDNYTFEDLAKYHPLLKKTAEEIEEDPASYVYNIITDAIQYHPDNIHDLGGNLKVYGGNVDKKARQYIGKKIDTIRALLEKGIDIENHIIHTPEELDKIPHNIRNIIYVPLNMQSKL